MSKGIGKIYVITNAITGSLYVGYTENPIEVRFKQHCQPNGKGAPILKNAMNKYGIEHFFIQEIYRNNDKHFVHEIMEPVFIDLLKPKYNLEAGGRGLHNRKGKKKTAEHNHNVALANVGRKQSEAQRLRNGELKRGAKQDPTVVARRVASSAKFEYEFTFPDGSIETGRSIHAFTKRHNLDSSCMTKVAHGKLPQHKGFKVRILEELDRLDLSFAARERRRKALLLKEKEDNQYRIGRENEELSKEIERILNLIHEYEFHINHYELVHPSGLKEYGSSIRQLAKKHGLDDGALGKVMNGKSKHHHGFTLKKLGGCVADPRAPSESGKPLVLKKRSMAAHLRRLKTQMIPEVKC